MILNSYHTPASRPAARKDYLWENILKLPYFRGLLRAVEARFYQDIDLPGPILDMGCGDGDFASMTFDRRLDAGIDPWKGPVRKARAKNCYRLVIQGQGNDMPFNSGHFKSVISNSVLEHIPDVEAVLKDIARVTAPGGVFVFCVPSENFLANLSISKFFDGIGLRKAGDAYRGFFNAISRHHHCDPAAIWQVRLEKAGFELEKWWNYFPPRALHTLEWGHYFGFPSFLIHLVTRRWILVQQKWNLAVTRKIIEDDYLRNPVDPKGSYTFYIARRK
jgi:SAM-dependent methyltransferase